MSSWERSRYIPWSRLKEVTNEKESLETQKERVFRSVQLEAEQESQDLSLLIPATNHQNLSSSTNLSTNLPPIVSNTQDENVTTRKRILVYSTSDLFRSLAFGACIGTITGTVFGFMDSMRSASESHLLKHASNAAKTKYLFEGTTRSASLFGVFFGGFHSLKYGLRILLQDPGHPVEIGGAALVSVGALALKTATRSSIPYATMLIAMDSISIYMKEEKQ